MLLLRADFNNLPSASLESQPYLQVASFANNKISSTEGVNHPLLEQLSLNCKFVNIALRCDSSRAFLLAVYNS